MPVVVHVRYRFLRLSSVPQACGFDYASVIDTVPPVEQVNVIARAIYQLTPDHQLFGELVYGYSDLLLRISPSPATGTIPFASGPYYPTAFATANGLSGDLDVCTTGR